ncbi:hypothetical protein KFK09_015112 [Dendrobium nobile]|uniref:Uncharacterized protein n=1 Tax=Dendrobium nobile TaxID=94219 RepID=A0A8T3B6B6_DENNO|nr:hypothetical protein KFK09_015112 [Dendrobium nobile]
MSVEFFPFDESEVTTIFFYRKQQREVAGCEGFFHFMSSIHLLPGLCNASAVERKREYWSKILKERGRNDFPL